MRKYQSKSIIAIGYAAICLLFFAVMLVWVKTVSLQRHTLDDILHERDERQLIFHMRDVAHKRTISLFRMTVLDDPFERDEEYLHFKELASSFIKSRNELLSRYLHGEEMDLWYEARKYIEKGGRLQGEAVQLILDDRIEEAQKVLKDQALPNQLEVMKRLTAMLDYASNEISEELEKASETTSSNYYIIATLVIVVLLIGGFIARAVMNRTDKFEFALVQQGQRVRSMYEVSAASGISPVAHISKMLELGCKLLDMEMGKICRIDPHTGDSTIISAFPENAEFQAGKVIPKGKTFCSVVFPQSEPLTLNHIGSSKFRKSSYYEYTKFESYIGLPVYMRGSKYGVVSFSKFTPRDDDFNDSDTDVVSLISSWVGFILEQKFAQDELKSARDEAESASRAKSAFLANMSHELRTPLNAIIGYSDLLKEEVETNEHIQYLPDLAKIKTSGEHLLSLISNVLDLTKIEAGKMEFNFSEVLVSDIITNIESAVKPLVAKNNNTFSVIVYDVVDEIFTDQAKLIQVLIIILSNANKFTRNGQVSLEVLVDDNNYEQKVMFRIKDSGIGMSPEQTSRVFDAFTQASTEITVKYGGTGLGLAISHRICKLMGGEIMVESELGKGSIFTVAMPANVNALVASSEKTRIA